MSLTSFQYPLMTFCICLIVGCHNDGQKPPSSSASSNTLAKTCIEKIIGQDDSLGNIRNHACKTIPLAETILNYAVAIEQLDYNQCPSTFEAAFKNHSKAWKQMVPFAERYPELRGEMHDLFDELEKGKDAYEFKPLLKEIWDTWGTVEEEMKQ